MSLKNENYRFSLEGDNEIFLRIVNITKPAKMEQCKQYIKNSVETKFHRDMNDDKPIKMSKYGKKVMVVLCAGDGSFMSIVEDLKNYGIDIDKIIFTQFPFGTANDVSSAFGWGRTPTKKMLNNLFYVCTELIEAKEVVFNIWEVTLKVRSSDGDILIPVGKNDKSLCTKKYTRLMCHSFSFGLEAKTIYGFERNRPGGRFCNKVVYGYEGFKIFCGCCCCNKTIRIKDLLSTFGKLHENVSHSSSDGGDDERKMNSSKENNEEVLISTDRLIDSKYYLKGDPISFVCTNVPAIMNGTLNLWKKEEKDTGLQNKDGSAVSGSIFNNTKCSIGDGKLEFGTSKSLLHLILGFTQKVCQDDGPFLYRFKEGVDVCAFMNIDGECFKVINPISATIKKADRIIKNGNLRVLVKDTNKQSN